LGKDFPLARLVVLPEKACFRNGKVWRANLSINLKGKVEG
jgi:hypothetical protein